MTTVAQSMKSSATQTHTASPYLFIHMEMNVILWQDNIHTIYIVIFPQHHMLLF